MCDTCGLPLEEGDHSQCKIHVELVACEEHSDEWRRIGVVEMKQSTTCVDAAYTEVTKTTEGTPEYYQALERFILVLFPDSSPPTTVPSET